MCIVRLLGYTTLSCGCLIVRYRDKATDEESIYVEAKGTRCFNPDHHRNGQLPTVRLERQDEGAARRLIYQTCSALLAHLQQAGDLG